MPKNDESIERGWMALHDAGRYAHVSPELLRRAVMRGELEAYEKPPTLRMGTTRGPTVLTKREFVDEYIRTHWRRAGAQTYGVPEAAAAAVATR